MQHVYFCDKVHTNIEYVTWERAAWYAIIYWVVTITYFLTRA